MGARNPEADLATALTERVLVADGAMGTMIQAADPSLNDFEGHEGCNEVLNVTRPDIIRSIHEQYSFGCPACPELEDRAKVMELLHPERIGVELSEVFQLHPEQSTDAIVVHHPQAKYFAAR